MAKVVGKGAHNLYCPVAQASFDHHWLNTIKRLCPILSSMEGTLMTWMKHDKLFRCNLAIQPLNNNRIDKNHMQVLWQSERSTNNKILHFIYGWWQRSAGKWHHSNESNTLRIVCVDSQHNKTCYKPIRPHASADKHTAHACKHTRYLRNVLRTRECAPETPSTLLYP